MSYTIGDGMVALALAGGIVGCLYVTRWSRQRRLEIFHKERMAAMEKSIPLPEFPLDLVQQNRPPSPNVIAILGLVLATLSVGAMIVMYLSLEGAAHSFWISPLPFAFLGVGFLALHFLKADISR